MPYHILPDLSLSYFVACEAFPHKLGLAEHIGRKGDVRCMKDEKKRSGHKLLQLDDVF